MESFVNFTRFIKPRKPFVSSVVHQQRVFGCVVCWFLLPPTEGLGFFYMCLTILYFIYFSDILSDYLFMICRHILYYILLKLLKIFYSYYRGIYVFRHTE
jgi:hypothetical protein